MKVAVTGAQGQLGQALMRRLPEQLKAGDVIPVTRADLDITDRRATRKFIQELAPDILINSAGYTAVDKAEEEPEKARQTNTTAVGYLAEAIAEAGGRLIHISTDYVFDGEKPAPYTEADTPCPLGEYARSKADGEKEALEKCPGALVVRTAWLYGHNAPNFVLKILEKGATDGKLKIVDDQFGSPTYADDLARAIGRLAPLDVKGIIHVANSGYCSWYQLAVTALKLAGLASVEVSPIDTDSYKTLAVRPKNSRLDTSVYARIAGAPLRHWRAALKDFTSREPTS